ncbi:hypothetical protein L7F22_066985 [Adiantum nelumboides]|nr:hypothetical protein [Adiantum nelumboides]
MQAALKMANIYFHVSDAKGESNTKKTWCREILGFCIDVSLGWISGSIHHTKRLWCNRNVVLNAGKSATIGPLPIMFIPFNAIELEKKHGDLLSYFMVPLVRDLEELFLKGLKTNFNYPCSYISSALQDEDNECTLRAVLMVWTGDHPAQCKLGLFKVGGKDGCRRDRVHAERVNSGQIPFYVYSNNRLQGRPPPTKRKVEDMLEALYMSRRVRTKKQKEETLADAGLVGDSYLWRMFHLYGFDLSRDLVFDTMHILSLNLFKKFIEALVEKVNNDTKRAIDAALKEVKDFMPRTLVANDRWPKKISCYSMFKAEENQKFVQWCLS